MIIDGQHLYTVETVGQAFAVGVLMGFMIAVKVTKGKEDSDMFRKKNEMVYQPQQPSTLRQIQAPQKQIQQPPQVGSGLFGGFMGLPVVQEAKEAEFDYRNADGSSFSARFKR